MRLTENDFKKATKVTMASRVGYRCSNPNCRAQTIGPNSDKDKVVNEGIACHIAAASEGGPRYDPEMTPEERSDISNGIWMCNNCSHLIDNDMMYTKEILLKWKADAEAQAARENGMSTSGLSQPEEGKKQGGPIILSSLLIGLFVAALLFPVVIVFVLKEPFVLWQRILYFAAVTAGACWFLNAIETRPAVARACFRTLTEEQLYDPLEKIRSSITDKFGSVPELACEKPEGFKDYYRQRHIEFGSWCGGKMNFMRISFVRGIEWYDPSVLSLHALSKGGQAIKMLIRQGFILKRHPFDRTSDVDYLTKGSLHVFVSYSRSRFLKIKLLDHAEIFNCTESEMVQYWEVVHRET